ncbi:MAG: MAPEG family protein [Rhodobacterales bacterium]|nr:MAPEG family protein [Rhodobacterales bacterium]
MLQIAPVYAGLLTVIFLILSVRVIDRRRSAGVSLGDGGDGPLQRRIRAHGNFADYAPMGLVLLTIAELAQAPAPWLHLAGACASSAMVSSTRPIGA